MVKLELYTEEFKKEYYSKVKNQIPIDKIQDIVRESKDFLPENFYSTASEDEFEELILAPFAKLKEAKEHIAKKSYGIMRIQIFIV